MSWRLTPHVMEAATLCNCLREEEDAKAGHGDGGPFVTVDALHAAEDLA